MRLYLYADSGEACIGIEKDGYLYDISDIAGDDMISLIEYFEDYRDEFLERLNVSADATYTSSVVSF